MIKETMVDVIGRVNESQKGDNTMMYLLLVHMTPTSHTEDDYDRPGVKKNVEDPEIRTWDYVEGRLLACKTIMGYFTKYGVMPYMFDSRVISEVLNSISTHSISFYSFLRFCIERGCSFAEDMTIDELNNYILTECNDECYNMGIHSVEDLTIYYTLDVNHDHESIAKRFNVE